jgi:hypothetical protein
MNFPPLTYIRQDDTHRLIPARYSAGSVLDRIADSPREVEQLFELDSATNDRLLGEAGRLPGISVHELVFGVSYAQIVNAAFTHPRPDGSRFNSSDRGAWYAGLSRKTCEAEVAFHKLEELAEINWQEEETAEYVDYLSDFHAEFHDLRGDEVRKEKAFANCLSPNSYTASQKLARQLLQAGSTGIIYPSVRHAAGTCIACFRPTLVMNVRQGARLTLTFRPESKKPIVKVAA